jgi:SAM-dependent methyltransferase
VTEGQDRAAALLQAARLALINHQVAVSGTDPQVVRLPESALPELIRAFAGTTAAVHQIVPFPGRPQNFDLFSLLVWRRHAMEGNEVRRLYLVPFGNPGAERIALQVEDDNASRIIAHRLYVGGSTETAVPMTNLWIVDDGVVIYEEYGDSGRPTWVVSARGEELRTARQRWDTLWQRRSEVEHEAPRVPEPLLESADMLHSIAQFACTGDHVDMAGCAWYHGVWQYLRLFNMVSSPNWHARFYEENLRRELHARARPRVLITGAADYGTLAYVLAAGDQPENLDIHVVDLCHTPLLANRWLGSRHGVEVGIHAVDFLQGGENLTSDLGSFDLVVSDAFLTRFVPADAERVVANWRRVLRPGGSVVTTVRLHDNETLLEDQSRAETDYLLRLYERAKNSHWLLKIDFDDLRHAAREYVQRMNSEQLGGRSDIESIFLDQGFRITKAEVDNVDGELQPAAYLRIVCHT